MIIAPPPEPAYQDSTITLHHGDCLDVLRSLPDASVDSVCCDPPYGLANTDPAHVAETITRWVNGERDYLPGGAGFMGKAWDAFVPPVAVWDDCLRVLKPGGHVLAFAGSRTVDLMTLGLRLAGFDIRDSIAWLYGSGFPKSLDVSKAIDKAAGTTGTYGEPKSAAHAGWLDRGRMRGEEGDEGWQRPWMQDAEALSNAARKYAPATDAARTWHGWGTALKPAFEPVVVARKPLSGTVAANVLAHGTGALNIDGCRVGTADDLARPIVGGSFRFHGFSTLDELRAAAEVGEKCPDGRDARSTLARTLAYMDTPEGRQGQSHAAGRWPANVVLDESQAAALDEQSGETVSKAGGKTTRLGTGGIMNPAPPGTPDRTGHDDQGGASRFFYVAKADASERVRVNGTAHPTVKPLALMRWLVRLVTPPGGTVLEPFAGSGTTVEACILEGFKCIAIEREADYLPLIVQRINRRRDPVEAVRAAQEDGGLFDLLDGGAA